MDVFQAMSTTSGCFERIRTSSINHKLRGKIFNYFFDSNLFTELIKHGIRVIGVRGTANVVKFISKNLHKKFFARQNAHGIRTLSELTEGADAGMVRVYDIVMGFLRISR